MNKRLIIVGVLVILAIAAGGYFMFANKTEPTPTITQENISQPTDSSQQSTIKELLATNTPRECTFSDNLEGSNVTGSVRVANQKMRGDFDTASEDQTTKSHMMIDGNTMYIWTDGQAQGIKMSLDALPSPDSSAGAQGNVDLDKKINYDCNDWIVDNSVFSLPTNIKFQDLSGLTIPAGSNQPGSSGGNSSQCAACNSLSGDAKTQCLKALSCN